jgi:CBS domain-containing protein
MTSQVVAVAETASIEWAARLMKLDGIGSLPVTRDGKVVGVVTDRDIVTRVVAEGHNPAEVKVRAAMTGEVITCTPDMTVDKAADLMERSRVRRLVVVDSGEVVGLLYVDDLAARLDENGLAGHVLKTVAEGFPMQVVAGEPQRPEAL